MHEGFESVVNEIFYWIIWFFEIIGAAIIIFGALFSIVKYIRGLIRHDKVSVKLVLANQLGLGLEFMLVAEIIKTIVTTNRNKDEIIILVATVLLRAALSVLIHWELKNEEKRIDVNEKKTKKLVSNKQENIN